MSTQFSHVSPIYGKLFLRCYSVYVLSENGQKCHAGFVEHLKHLWPSCFDVLQIHDDVINLKHCPRCRPFVCGGHRWIFRSKASVAELWCFLLICTWINGWVNNREAGDLRRRRSHYDVTVMLFVLGCIISEPLLRFVMWNLWYWKCLVIYVTVYLWYYSVLCVAIRPLLAS